MNSCILIFISFVLLIVLLVVKKLMWTSQVSSLKNKHVLVTGGSSGIGLATAVEAAKLGARVTIIARNREKLEAATNEIRKHVVYPSDQKIQYRSVVDAEGYKKASVATALQNQPLFDLSAVQLLLSHTSPCDGDSAASGQLNTDVETFSKSRLVYIHIMHGDSEIPEQTVTQFVDVSQGLEAVEREMELAEECSGPIFLLVNCAGMAVCGEFQETSESDYRYMMDLNYFGTVFPTVSVAKKMKSRKQGHIVITGSQASLLGIYGMSGYCASKFALRGFAESLYMELKPYNVSVTLCLPPDTDTPGFATEEKSKPQVTRLISETAGLFDPRTVAVGLLSDALNKKFFSSVGFEALILTTLCAGMSPICSVLDVIVQISLMSILRLVSVGYLLHFQNIIRKHSKKGSGKEESEKIKS